MKKAIRRIQVASLEEYRGKILYLRDIKRLPWAKIGRELDKDHTTIMYQYRKAKEIGTITMVVEEEIKTAVTICTVEKETKLETTHKYDRLIFDPVCRGNSYEEYVAKADKGTRIRAASMKKSRDDLAVKRFTF